MSGILRQYQPSECDQETGAPLGWSRCRGLDELDGGMGSLHEAMRQRGEDCPWCDGHGSLKAAALYSKSLASLKAAALSGKSLARFPPGRTGHVVLPVAPLRCEDCGHLMSEGTWEGPARPHGLSDEAILLGVERVLRTQDREPDYYGRVHFSACDEGCRHGGPVRAWTDDDGWLEQDADWMHEQNQTQGGDLVRGGTACEASWRSVDVYTLGWPHDLTPENLAALCLRCWAARPPAYAGARGGGEHG